MQKRSTFARTGKKMIKENQPPNHDHCKINVLKNEDLSQRKKSRDANCTGL
jgi:hypothetical protein